MVRLSCEFIVCVVTLTLIRHVVRSASKSPSSFNPFLRTDSAHWLVRSSLRGLYYEVGFVVGEGTSESTLHRLLLQTRLGFR